MDKRFLHNVFMLFINKLWIIIMVMWIWFGIRQYKKTGKTNLLIFLLLFAFWLFWGNYVNVHRNPPGDAETLSEFLQEMETPYQINFIMVNNTPYFELREQWSLVRTIIEIVFIFQSGPPSCIFNKEGYMIDWTPDIEENHNYQKKWIQESTYKQPISPEEALDFIKTWSQSN